MASDVGKVLNELLAGNCLLDQHVADLARSGISREQALQAGIRSIDDAAQKAIILRRNYAIQSLGPCMVFTFLRPDGSLDTDYARLKPDRPRQQRGSKTQGKDIKYESPTGMVNRAYFLEGTITSLSDPSVDLLFTEGEKKSLKGMLSGFMTIGLVGVWGWQLKRERDSNDRPIGDRKLIPELERIVWKGRRISIGFDSDAIRKPEVMSAEIAFAEVLQERGASVFFVRLPDLPASNGLFTKCGLDDYLLVHSAKELRDLIETSTPFDRRQFREDDLRNGWQIVNGRVLTESGYVAHDGSTFHCELEFDENSGERRIVSQTKLANFSAKIGERKFLDDGAQTRSELSISVEQRGQPAVTVEIPVEELTSLDWVVEKVGPKYIIQPGYGKKEHLRCAIQELSGNEYPTSKIYEHTGWRKIGEKWVYLHAGGAIGEDGAVGGITASLPEGAKRFRLPSPPVGEELRNAVRSSLRLLDGLAFDSVAFSLLSTVYRTVLGGADYSLWLLGRTGVGKSELAALGQQHFGSEMVRNQLPGNWASTDNALEGMAFTLKDTIFVVDDFCPSGSRQDHDRMHQVADRVIRGAGNSAGRQRMNANGSLRMARPPRCLVLATGEDLPRGHSLTARLWTPEVVKNSVSFSRLSACQKDAREGRYALAMAGFIQWIAKHYGGLADALVVQRMAIRDDPMNQFHHSRTPDMFANIQIGLTYLLRFALSIGAIDQKKHDLLLSRGAQALRAVAERQGQLQVSFDPIARFGEQIQSLLSSGRVHIAGTDGKEPGIPPSPEFWGWERRDSRVAVDNPPTIWKGRGEKIGWVRGDDLYLNPDASYAALVKLAQDQGLVFSVGQDSLQRGLRDAGMLIRHDPDRFTAKVSLEGARPRVLVLSASKILSLPDVGQPGQSWQARDSNHRARGDTSPSSPRLAESRGKQTNLELPGNTADDDSLAPVAPLAPVSRQGCRTPNERLQQRSLFDEGGLDALKG